MGFKIPPNNANTYRLPVVPTFSSQVYSHTRITYLYRSLLAAAVP